MITSKLRMLYRRLFTGRKEAADAASACACLMREPDGIHILCDAAGVKFSVCCEYLTEGDERHSFLLKSFDDTDDAEYNKARADELVRLIKERL